MTVVPSVRESARAQLLADTIELMDASSRLALYDFLRTDRLPPTRILSNLCRARLLKFARNGYEPAEGVREAVMAVRHRLAVG